MAIFATKKFTASTSKKGLRVTPKAATTKRTRSSSTRSKSATRGKRR